MRRLASLSVLAVGLCAAAPDTATTPTLRQLIERSVQSPRDSGDATTPIHEGSGAVAARPKDCAVSGDLSRRSEVPAASDGVSGSKGPEDSLGRDTPRGTLEGFLRASGDRDFKQAAQYLDLRSVPEEQRDSEGPRLAEQLNAVLARTVWIDPEALSDSPRGEPLDGLPANRDRLARIDRSGHPPVDLLLQRGDRGDHMLIWRVAPPTVAAIPRLYREFGNSLVEQLLPEELAHAEILDIPIWQWVGLAIDAILAWFAAVGATAVAARLASSLPRPRATPLYQRLLNLSHGPARLLLAALIFSTARSFLGLNAVASAASGALEKTLASITLAWWLIRTVDILAVELHPRLLQRGQGSLAPLVVALRKLAKALVIVFLAMMLLNNAGFDVTTLLAGLGIGGIAVALAAQKSLENLFGGVTLFLDRPVRIGDPCRFGDRVGTVEEIGLRSTRIRTPDRTLVAIPNSEFSNLQLENLGSRDKIWFHPTLSVRSDTRPKQMKRILAELAEMLVHHDNVDANNVYARFVGFGAYSLNIDLSAYVITGDWSRYLAIAEDLHLRCMEIIERAGSGLAFSAPPIHISRSETEEEVDEGTRRRAPHRVRVAPSE